MSRRKPLYPWIARTNRRGCFVIGIVLALFLAALAFIGFSADPINHWNAIIPIRK